VSDTCTDILTDDGAGCAKIGAACCLLDVNRRIRSSREAVGDITLLTVLFLATRNGHTRFVSDRGSCRGLAHRERDRCGVGWCGNCSMFWGWLAVVIEYSWWVPTFLSAVKREDGETKTGVRNAPGNTDACPCIAHFVDNMVCVTRPHARHNNLTPLQPHKTATARCLQLRLRIGGCSQAKVIGILLSTPDRVARLVLKDCILGGCGYC
jgi:hypothetical protein